MQDGAPEKRPPAERFLARLFASRLESCSGERKYPLPALAVIQLKDRLAMPRRSN